MYASVSDMRAEGVSEAQASDERLAALLDEASRAIDRLTGWFFEPRTLVLRLDGRGTATIEPPVPPIALTELVADGRNISLASNDLVVVGAPAAFGFDAPRLTRTFGRCFPKGRGNVEATGVWGYTEINGTPHGRTPLAIRRACILLAQRWLAPLGEGDTEARTRWRVIEERTRDQSYKLDRPIAGTLSGDPDIDAILMRFRRPLGLGAA
ncbi:conserved hypothetical protein [Haliangium ochraceum DSM 14365]|uniref:Uncharacterized protein n=2 Tax=Haliangium ochraceum TaxID=80816 RepID=D0LP91_HALO1|nr:conserved hypothetical protein [Haliangium ochraceum DSM 14365]